MPEKEKLQRQRQRKVVPLPARLRWPTLTGGRSSNQQQNQASTSRRNTSDRLSVAGNTVAFVPTIDKINISSKRRRIKRNSNFDRLTDVVSNDLWVDKYAPTNATELCVAPKKVNEVQSWIQSFSNGQQSPSKLLILVGSPGIGKSTMVRVLVKELGLDLREWNDSYYDSSQRTQSSSSCFAASINSKDSLMMVRQESPLQLFDKFLKQTGAGFQSLDFTTTRAANVKNRSGKKRKSGKAALNRGADSVILIDELPNLHTPESKLRFREIMKMHLIYSQVPTILVFSDTREGKHRPDDLETLIDSTYLYSPVVQIMQIQSVVKARLTKVLNNIAKKEKLTRPPHLFEKLHLQSGGDIRYAIMTLQFDNAANNVTTDPIYSKQNENENKRVQMYERDIKLSAFHALGKALYAKRIPASSLTDSNARTKNSDECPPLDFDPDGVLYNCDMGLSSAITFLESHCVDFFTNIFELSKVLDHFSNAAFFCDEPIDQRQHHSVFPDSYVASLGGRAVAATNKHPTVNRFRQLSAPKIFDVTRKRRENESQYRNLHQRLVLGTGNLHLGNTSTATKTFVTDSLPFIRLISPSSVNISIDRMHSYFLPRNGERQGKLDKNTEAESAVKMMQEQEQILQMDDIMDDDSVDESCSNRFLPSGPSSTTLEPRTIANVAAQKKTSPPSILPASSLPAPSPLVRPDIIIIDDSD